MFRLDPRLEAETAPVASLVLCEARLMRDARFPWLVLVPRRAGLRELDELAGEDRALLFEEIAAASTALRQVAHLDKLNVGALGNLVPQLHVHVVARRRDDAAWPGAVWGSGSPVPYETGAERAVIAALRRALPGADQTSLPKI